MVRGGRRYCPVAKATEILGDRWTLLIVREMLGGASGFNEHQRGLPGISRSVLTDRMRALERAEVIERRTGPKGRNFEYRLTSAGRDLEPAVQAIGEWGATWSVTEPRPEELDPYLLIVWMARHVDRRRLTQPDRGQGRLSRSQAALLDGRGALRGLSLSPASRFRRSTSRSASTRPRSTASTWDGPSWAARLEPAG
jgi:DNA-binding HxlR family transcriptional regulator